MPIQRLQLGPLQSVPERGWQSIASIPGELAVWEISGPAIVHFYHGKSLAVDAEEGKTARENGTWPLSLVK